MRNVYWLAIDKNRNNSTYADLVEREVVAQGWPHLGDLTDLRSLVLEGKKDLFIKKIQGLGDLSYGGEEWWDVVERKKMRFLK